MRAALPRRVRLTPDETGTDPLPNRRPAGDTDPSRIKDATNRQKAKISTHGYVLWVQAKVELGPTASWTQGSVGACFRTS